jgi:transforming growth factor-beta-induced protein
MKRFMLVALLLSLVLSACARKTTPTQTIAELAASDPQFSSLVEVLGEAGLTETLNGAGPFTVFAPTNAAFAKLESAPTDLSQTLLYHVLPQKLEAANLTSQASGVLKTQQGADINYIVEAGSVILIDGQSRQARVTSTDLQATNGVIHVIDAVLLLAAPPALR